ncbi:MAG TPA: hypothetical protein EYN66_24370, partial [Myxococcales bacterium]|nr:hypothetical protein [Myxococcales bacterium]
MSEQLSQDRFRFAAVMAIIATLGCSGSQEIMETPDTKATNSDLGGQASGGGDTGPGDDTSISGCSLAVDCMHLLIGTTCKRPLCSNGTCALNSAANGLPCKDSDSCFVGKTCLDGECLGGIPKYCDDQNLC